MLDGYSLFNNQLNSYFSKKRIVKLGDIFGIPIIKSFLIYYKFF